MSYRIECNRCRKQAPTDRNRFSGGWPTMPVGFTRLFATEEPQNWSAAETKDPVYELCPDCMRALDRWVTDGVPGVAE